MMKKPSDDSEKQNYRLITDIVSEEPPNPPSEDSAEIEVINLNRLDLRLKSTQSAENNPKLKTTVKKTPNLYRKSIDPHNKVTLENNPFELDLDWVDDKFPIRKNNQISSEIKIPLAENTVKDSNRNELQVIEDLHAPKSFSSPIQEKKPKLKKSTESQESFRKFSRTKELTEYESDKRGSHQFHGSPVWILIIAVIFISGTIFLVVIDQKSKNKKAQFDKDEYKSIALEKSIFNSVKVDEEFIDILSTGMQHAFAIIKEYHSPDNKFLQLDSIYKGFENSNIIQKAESEKKLFADWKLDDSFEWLNKEYEGVTYWVLFGKYPDGEPLTAFFRTEGGKLKLDWKATVGYGTADFQSLAEGHGDTSELRLILIPADFYTHNTPETVYKAYKINSRDGNEYVWGYADMSKKVYKEILEHVIRKRANDEMIEGIFVTAKLEKPSSDILPNQWIISEIHSFDWIDK